MDGVNLITDRSNLLVHYHKYDKVYVLYNYAMGQGIISAGAVFHGRALMNVRKSERELKTGRFSNFRNDFQEHKVPIVLNNTKKQFSTMIEWISTRIKKPWSVWVEMPKHHYAPGPITAVFSFDHVPDAVWFKLHYGGKIVPPVTSYE